MRKSIFTILFILFSLSVYVSGQTPNRSPEKIRQDSIEFEKFRKDEPELFLNKRLPTKLLDGNFYIKGFSNLGIRISNNHLIDSVYHNFHLGSTEKDIIPYNNILVTESLVNIDLFGSCGFTEMKSDSSEITLLDSTSLKKGSINGKPIKYDERFSGYVFGGLLKIPDTISIKKFEGKEIELRISLNGKLLFDWKPLISFPRFFAKTTQKMLSIKYDPTWYIGYNFAYNIAKQKLSINDQLLIEIKETKKGWMLDRFNITRVAATPAIEKVIALSSEKNNSGPYDNSSILPEKKTLH